MTDSRLPRIRVGLVVPREGNILLVCHRKEAKRYWLLPGGGLQWGEELACCGAREVKEETGLDVSVGRLLFILETIDPAGSRHILHFIFEGTYQGGKLRCPTEEIIETVEWSPIASLDNVKLYPPIGTKLRNGLENGFPFHPTHVSVHWAD